MAIYRVQRPPQISSSWTTEKFVKMIRTLLDELDNAKLLDQEIRYYTNLAVSSVANASTEGSDAGYYGVLMQGMIDAAVPLWAIDLDTPLWDKDYDQPPKRNSLGAIDYAPAREVNAHVIPMDNTAAPNSAINSPNLFNETISEVPVAAPGVPLTKDDYQSYFVASGIIDQVVDVTLSNIVTSNPLSSTNTLNLPLDFFSAFTKLSYSELTYLKAHSYMFNQHGAWTFFGSKIYLLLGKDILSLITDIAGVHLEAISVDIAVLRKPTLDNLKEAWDPKSGWWSHIDLPDKHMRLLAITVQKMCLDKLGKRLSPDHEAILNQLFGGASQAGQFNTIAMQADRMKQEQGFQNR